MATYAAAAAKSKDGKAKKRPHGPLWKHAARLAMFNKWEQRQRPNRREAALDRAYFDGDQLTDDEREELRGRGQPETIFNYMADKLNTLIGEQIEKRVDKNAKPRTPKHENDARAATALLRFAADEQKSQRITSRVAESCWKEGIGVAIKTFESGKHVARHVEYDRFGYDVHSRDPLFSDARGMWVINWIYRDDCIEKFGDDAEKFFDDGGEDDDISGDQPRWLDYADPDNPRLQVIEFYFEDGTDWYCAYFTRKGDLAEPERTWLLDEKKERSVNPVKAVSCYVKQNGDRYGILRNLRSIQDAINKRESKSIHLMNADQVIAEEGVITNPEKFKAELANPDGLAEVAMGSLFDPTTGRERIIFRRNTEIAMAHVQMHQNAVAALDRTGPSSSSIPEMPVGASGRAIIQRRKASSLRYGMIFDNLAEWSHEFTLLDWFTIRQEYNEERVFRISDETEGYRWVTINRDITRKKFFGELMRQKPPVPAQEALETVTDTETAPEIIYDAKRTVPMLAQRAQQMGQQVPPDQLLIQAITLHPLMQLSVSVNKVAEMDVDIVIADAPDTSVIAEEEFATITEMMPALIQARQDLAPKMVRLLIQASTLPDKRELIAMLDAQPDPKMAAMQQQNQQLAQKNAMLELQLKQAQVQKTGADARLADARAQTELAQLNLPLEQQQPEAPDPLRHAQAHREQVGTQLDVHLANAEIEESRSRTAKNMAGAAASARKATEPPTAPGGPPV